MRVRKLHDWSVAPQEALRIQRKLRSRIAEAPIEIGKIKCILGADVSSSRGSNDIFAAVSVLSFPSLEVIEERTAIHEAVFPYIPGLLAFREAPALALALEKVKAEVDVAIFDGHGIAHPRGLGIASHVGLMLGIPSIGCAKTRFVGQFEEPGPRKGERSPLIYRGKVVGSVVRTRDRVAPVFVSIGNGIDLECAVEVVLVCCVRYRLPEPIRRAHALANALRRLHGE